MTLRAFTMPKWGIEMQEGTLAEWLIGEGDRVDKGQLIALVETDKITNEVEAPEDGILYKIVAPQGETRTVGELLAVFGEAGQPDTAIDEFLANFKAADTSMAAGKAASGAKQTDNTVQPSASSARAPIPDGVAISPKARALAESLNLDISTLSGSGQKGRLTVQDIEQAVNPAAPSLSNGAPVDISVLTNEFDKFYASPLAKRLAKVHGIDLGDVRGTGPRGRISKTDVLNKAGISPAEISTSDEPEILPMSSMRKTIARRLTQAKTTIPHFYLRSQACLDPLLEAKKISSAAAGVKLSVNDFLLKALATSLMNHRDMNVHVHDGEIHRFSAANIAIAVASDKGLTTPVLKNAQDLSITELSEASSALIDRARTSRLTREDLEGGTFTLSNLGMFDIDQFDAIINPPQGAILAVGTSRRVWTEQANGEGAFATMIQLSLSCDHRAIDGATGAQFLASLKSNIENPAELF